MADRSAADRACKDPNPIIDGRKANVNLAYLGAKPRVMQPGKDKGKIIRPFMEPQTRSSWFEIQVRFSLLPVKKHFHTGISGESVVYLVGRKTLGHWIVALGGRVLGTHHRQTIRVWACSTNSSNLCLVACLYRDIRMCLEL